MPLILIFCVVGSFAINNSVFGVGIMLVMGVLGYIMEENGFPMAPAILGLVLGGMIEANFLTSMIKSNGQLLGFFQQVDRRRAGMRQPLRLRFGSWWWP